MRVAAARGWDPVIVREQESGSKRRPGWQSVLDSVHRGEVGAVVVWALDRAGRDRVRLAHDLAELARKGAVVVSVRESWVDQPAGPLRDLLIQVMAWFAEAERARIIERTRAGQARARAAGKRFGRPCLPASVQVELRVAYDSGASVGATARALGLPTSTVRTYWRRWDREKCSQEQVAKTAET